eukprot:TRINITY_DN3601_c0_g1_i1.p1 TRINITY_DN3601_c0_g1~~TRINITY_DN3601_c0_g1_i1.p1  ORF type:complete len:131 (-),score=24.18 TRINITY_DN3601_c0_g1_i1:355-747(-)
MTDGARWPPMESNPTVMTEFAGKLGLNTDEWQFADVWSLDEEMWSFLPDPLAALIMLRPSGHATEVDDGLKGDDSVFHLRQIGRLDQACGTIAIIHILANSMERLGLGSYRLFIILWNSFIPFVMLWPLF